MDILRTKTRWNCVQETLNKVLTHNSYKDIRVQYKGELLANTVIIPDLATSPKNK